MDTCRSSVAIHVILQTSWHFTFWHPFAYLSCSSLLLFPFAATPLFLGYVIVCCVYVWVCYCMFCMLCGFRDMPRIQMEAYTLYIVCMICRLGVTVFLLSKAWATIWPTRNNKLEKFRRLADLGLNRRTEGWNSIFWPSFPYVACFRNFTQCVG